MSNQVHPDAGTTIGTPPANATGGERGSSAFVADSVRSADGRLKYGATPDIGPLQGTKYFNDPGKSLGNSAYTNRGVPTAPTIGTATGGSTQASVAFTAPTDLGGLPLKSYTATSTPGNKTASGTSSPLVVTGLTNGTAYTFKVTATNRGGLTSPDSAASNSVTPA